MNRNADHHIDRRAGEAEDRNGSANQAVNRHAYKLPVKWEKQSRHARGLRDMMGSGR